jgi:ubiquinone/menaquinone biosynthesis C-methylase UbiE
MGSAIDLKGQYDVYRDGKLGDNQDAILSMHINLLSEKLSKDAEVLDIGCGLGQLAFELSKRSKRVHAIDPSDYNISRAKTMNGADNIEYAVGDGADLKFENGRFDIIVSSEVIEHVKDFRKFLREMHRVGKKGAYYSVSSPNLHIFWMYPFYWLYALRTPIKYAKIVSMNDNIKEYKELYDRWFYPSALKRYFAEEGFVAEKIVTAVPFESDVYYEKYFGKGSFVSNMMASLDRAFVSAYSRLPLLKELSRTRFFIIFRKKDQ